MSKLLRTPLYESQIASGAKMVDFAGWEMPVSFGSIIDEHRAVREKAGIFDISHMGELVFRGPNAAEKLEKVFSRRVSDLDIGAGRYGLLLTEQGTVVDDLIIYRTDVEEFFAVVNASRISADVAHIQRYCGTDWFENQSNSWSALALQGPVAVKLWESYSQNAAPARFGIASLALGKVNLLVARTGYTGEDGVEIIVPSQDVVDIWKALLSRGAAPCGLGARDSLRVEAGYPLYGHELSEELTALESGAGWAVDFTKEKEWLGSTALSGQKQKGVSKKLVYLTSTDKSAIPREGYKLFNADEQVGYVTSGVFGPTVGSGVGMAIVNSPYFSTESQLDMEVRGRRSSVSIFKKPLYKAK